MIHIQGLIFLQVLEGCLSVFDGRIQYAILGIEIGPTAALNLRNSYDKKMDVTISDIRTINPMQF